MLTTLVIALSAGILMLILVTRKDRKELSEFRYQQTKEPVSVQGDQLSFTESLSPAFSIGDSSVKGMASLMQRLDDAWDPVYMGHVRERVLKKGEIREENYPYYEQELKRFFLLTTLYPNVPMFNTYVDDIWHEMMMFTRSYDKFCQTFVGQMIHHEPNMSPGAPNPNEKPFFMWVYRFLFGITSDTVQVYPFLSHQELSFSVLKNIEQLSENMLIDHYFAPLTPDAGLVAKHIVADTKKRVEGIHEKARFHKRTPSLVKANYRKTSTESKDAFLFESMLEADLFDFEPERDVASISNSHSSKYDSHSSTNTYTDTSHSTPKHSCSSSNCSSSNCSGSSCSGGSSCGGGGCSS